MNSPDDTGRFAEFDGGKSCQVDAIMGAGLRSGSKCVEDSDGISGVHGFGDFVARHPTDFGGFCGRGAGLGFGVAAED